MGPFSNFIILLFAVLAGLMLFGKDMLRGLGRRMSIETTNASVLLAYYTLHAKLLPVKRGHIGDYYFTSFITTAGEGKPVYDHIGAVFIIVDLPFATKTHLLGIPKGNNTIQLDPTKGDSVMEEVVLEGDYPNYFSLYADHGQQLNTRYFMDPVAMAFTVDFCQSHNWEITDTELIFTKHVLSTHKNDPTRMSEDVVKFIEAIRPAIEIPLTPLQAKRRQARQQKKREAVKRKFLPYNHDKRESLPCPVCQESMPNQDTHFICPQHDGILISGRYLTDLRKGELDIKIHDQLHRRGKDNKLTCPSCQSPMEAVKHATNDTIIDSCTKCHYRWIEDGELGI